VRAEEWLLEGILARSPRLAARLAQRVLAPLAEDAGALEGTLRALLDHRMDRTATSASLQIHRNTLAYRLARIEKLTGLDLSDPRDLACVHLALQARAAQTG
jgi:DNA-binding PucR family transcriptional regulator